MCSVAAQLLLLSVVVVPYPTQAGESESFKECMYAKTPKHRGRMEWEGDTG